MVRKDKIWRKSINIDCFWTKSTPREYETLDNCRKRVLEPRIYHSWNLPYLWMEPANSFYWLGQWELGFLMHVTESILTDRPFSGHSQCSTKIPLDSFFYFSPISSASNGLYLWHSSEDDFQATRAALLVCSELEVPSHPPQSRP